MKKEIYYRILGEAYASHIYENGKFSYPTKEGLEAAMLHLTEREREALILYTGLRDGSPKTFVEVGKIFGVSGNRIMQIVNKAFRKLRHPLTKKIVYSK